MNTRKYAPIVILSVAFCCVPAAHATGETSTASASASAAPVPSPTRLLGTGGVAMAAYDWPTTASEQPKEEEWAQATEFAMLETEAASGWDKKPVRCKPRAVREWIWLDCFPPDPPVKEGVEGQRFYGSVWGLAGDIAGTSVQFTPVSSVERYAKGLDPKADEYKMILRMGAVGSLIFQAKVGSAMMLRLDEIYWARYYYGGGDTMVSPGIVIDVSWALGEKYPTISIKG